MPYFAGPKVVNRPQAISADVDIPPGGAEGVLACHQPALCRSPHPQVPSPTLKVGTTRGMQAFSIDDDRLSAVVAHYAPSVRIVNLG